MNGGVDISLTTAAQRLADGLRLYVGTGRRFSVAAFADSIGAAENSVRNWMAGEATPSMDTLYRMMAVLPDAFTLHLLELTGKEWRRAA